MFAAQPDLATSTAGYGDLGVASRHSKSWVPDQTRPYGLLANWTVENISELVPCIEAVQTTEIEKVSLNQKFKLWAYQWRLTLNDEHVGTCRMVLIQGTKNEIINTWVFPANPRHSPVFAAELIAMAGEPRLTFVDIQAPSLESNRNNVKERTTFLRKKHETILTSETPPVWAISESLGGYVFSRQLGEWAFTEITRCYKDYLSLAVELYRTENSLPNAPPKNQLPQAIDALTDYQTHHRESSPGNAFLSKLFGDDWTNDFLRTFLFTVA